MAENSKIEWTDHSLNFWWGCMKVSPGCQHCYAETLSKRWGKHIWGPNSERPRTKQPWKDILKWDAKARADGIRLKVFTQSMSDFFEDHPTLNEVNGIRVEALAILANLTNIDIQLLTKRPENITRMVPGWWLMRWPEHIWIGTSVEDQKRADKRIPELLKIPAKVRFLSCEPLLEPVELNGHDYKLATGLYQGIDWLTGQINQRSDIFGGDTMPWLDRDELIIPADLSEPRIHWVIVGGESGPGARPMQAEWAYSLKKQCEEAGVAFFMKQGSSNNWPYYKNFDSFPEDLRVREFPI